MISFEKYQGLGNDFVLFDHEHAQFLAPANPAVIQSICNRRLGIGADGILLILPSETGATLKMMYYNADGSFAETCFNGLRCVALHALRSGRVKADETFIIESPTGPVTARVSSLSGQATIELDGPKFEPTQVPVESDRELIEGRLAFSFGSLIGTALSIGNPHFVVWRESAMLSELDAESRRIGGEVEKSHHFPRATNFELASVRTSSLVEMTVWERGVGPTLACGSGATATVCAGVKAGRLMAGHPIRVRMPGGELSVEVDADFGRVHVVGGADFVFNGTIPLKNIGLK